MYKVLIVGMKGSPYLTPHYGRELEDGTLLKAKVTDLKPSRFWPLFVVFDSIALSRESILYASGII